MHVLLSPPLSQASVAGRGHQTSFKYCPPIVSLLTHVLDASPGSAFSRDTAWEDVLSDRKPLGPWGEAQVGMGVDGSLGLRACYQAPLLQGLLA